MSRIEISNLSVHYIKSCGGTSVETLQITEDGPYLDRYWSLFDMNNNFISQRDFSKLALVIPHLTKDSLFITAPNTPSLMIPIHYKNSQTKHIVDVWGNKCIAEYDGKHASDWFGSYLNFECRLMHVSPDDNRNKSGSRFGFADSYPLTIDSDESVADLNARIVANGGEPIMAYQFRSNIRIKCDEAYFEDTLKEIAIGDEVNIEVVKPVVRCKIPQIDQKTGILGKEPAKTLSQYRMVSTTDENGKKVNQILFAQKARQLTTGQIRVGDKVTVYSHKEPPKFR